MDKSKRGYKSFEGIFATGELKEETVIRKNWITAADGKDYETMLYNLASYKTANISRTLIKKSRIGKNLVCLMKKVNLI